MENIINFDKENSMNGKKSRRELLEQWQKSKDSQNTNQLRTKGAPATPAIVQTKPKYAETTMKTAAVDSSGFAIPVSRKTRGIPQPVFSGESNTIDKFTGSLSSEQKKQTESETSADNNRRLSRREQLEQWREKNGKGPRLSENASQGASVGPSTPVRLSEEKIAPSTARGRYMMAPKYTAHLQSQIRTTNLTPNRVKTSQLFSTPRKVQSQQASSVISRSVRETELSVAPCEAPNAVNHTIQLPERFKTPSKENPSTVQTVEFSTKLLTDVGQSDGTQMASMTMEQRLKLWKMKKQMNKIQTPGKDVAALSFNPTKRIAPNATLDFSGVYDALIDDNPTEARLIFSKMRIEFGAAIEKNVEYWVERAAMEEYLQNWSKVAELYERAMTHVPKNFQCDVGKVEMGLRSSLRRLQRTSNRACASPVGPTHISHSVSAPTPPPQSLRRLKERREVERDVASMEDEYLQMPSKLRRVSLIEEQPLPLLEEATLTKEKQISLEEAEDRTKDRHFEKAREKSLKLWQQRKQQLYNYREALVTAYKVKMLVLAIKEVILNHLNSNEGKSNVCSEVSSDVDVRGEQLQALQVSPSFMTDYRPRIESSKLRGDSSGQKEDSKDEELLTITADIDNILDVNSGEESQTKGMEMKDECKGVEEEEDEEILESHDDDVLPGTPTRPEVNLDCQSPPRTPPALTIPTATRTPLQTSNSLKNSWKVTCSSPMIKNTPPRRVKALHPLAPCPSPAFVSTKASRVSQRKSSRLGQEDCGMISELAQFIDQGIRKNRRDTLQLAAFSSIPAGRVLREEEEEEPACEDFSNSSSGEIEKMEEEEDNESHLECVRRIRALLKETREFITDISSVSTMSGRYDSLVIRTPGGKLGSAAAPGSVFVTPVRRSARLVDKTKTAPVKMESFDSEDVVFLPSKTPKNYYN